MSQNPVPLKKRIDTMQRISVVLSTAFFLFAAIALSFVETSRASDEPQAYFPLRLLRGYGSVKADYQEYGQGSSVLTIHAENAAAAQLWQARFLFDLTETVGKSRLTAIPNLDFNAFQTLDGNVWTAIRIGTDVSILSAPSQDRLENLIRERNLSANRSNTATETAIPKYLNEFSRYAFRFYYWPGHRPEGFKGYYDFLPEFDFMKRSGPAGLILWAGPFNPDLAAGMANDSQWNWAHRLAQAFGIPLILNTNCSGQPAISNAFRDDNVERAPDFMGSYHSVGEPHHGGVGFTSWASVEARDAELSLIQQIIRKYNDDAVIEFLEPHGELCHGDYSVFLEYGPLVDKSFQAFLKSRYKTLENVSLRYGRKFNSWSDVRLPEVAEFFGWNERAVSLAGPWRLNYLEYADPQTGRPANGVNGNEMIPVQDVPNDWYGPEWDDSSWPLARQMPGSDETQFLPNRPAVARRRFDLVCENTTVPAAHINQVVSATQSSQAAPTDSEANQTAANQKAANQTAADKKATNQTAANPPLVTNQKIAWNSDQVWLYLWDLNQGNGDTVEVWLNGNQLGVDTLRHTVPHWGAWNVTGKLKPKGNLLAVRLPKGSICYRVYLTDTAPQSYPYLSPERNALWVDFSDWQGFSRALAVERGLKMIRSVEPNKSIVSMAPDQYFVQLRDLAQRYGARFHNTGYMSAFFCEMLPMLMRGADLPFSLEPGGPAKDLDEFKKFTGLYMVSGVNAIHYFIHVGYVLWNDSIREYFQKIEPALAMLGQEIQEKSDAAVLLDSDVDSLLGYPWVNDVNAAYPSGYMNWRFNESLRNDYPLDAITPTDFCEDASGRSSGRSSDRSPDRSGSNGSLASRASQYKVIFDANNTILREQTLAGIERWVRDGGIFVAMTQTGRHEPLKPDCWPISRISGFQYVGRSEYLVDKSPVEWQPVRLAEGQTFFPSGEYPQTINADGTRWKPICDQAKPLWLWPDGTTAVGIRKLGKGYVITFGWRLPYWEAKTRQVLCDVLKFAQARPMILDVPRSLFAKQYLSTNGLYDIWVLWNSDSKNAQEYRFQFRDGQSRTLVNALTNEPAGNSGTLPPGEFVVCYSLRKNGADAARKWFNVQYNWWNRQQTPWEEFKPETSSRLESDYTRNTLPLTDGWTRTVSGKSKTVSLGAWLDSEIQTENQEILTGGQDNQNKDQDNQNKNRRVAEMTLERSVTVPKDWSNGQINLWITSQYLGYELCNGEYQVFLDGQSIARPGRDGVAHLPLDVRPGQTFQLKIEARNNPDERFRGIKGICFLSYMPNPSRTIDLSGSWQARTEVNSPVPTSISVPAERLSAACFTRTFSLDEKLLNQADSIYVFIEGDPRFDGVIVNGQYVRRHHHRIGQQTYLNITKWLKSGENEITVIVDNKDGAIDGWVKTIELRLFEVLPKGSQSLIQTK